MTETPKQKRERLKAAAPAWMRAVAAAKARKAYREHKLGKLGAGPCKRIDPKTGEVIEIIEAKGK